MEETIQFHMVAIAVCHCKYREMKIALSQLWIGTPRALLSAFAARLQRQERPTKSRSQL